MKYTLSLIALLQLAGHAVAAESPFSIDSDDAIKKTASTLASDLLKYYKGNEPGETPGLLPDPYYFWQAGAMWSSLVEYWHYTGDSSHNDLVSNAILSQISLNKDFMPLNQTLYEGNDDQSFWALAALVAAERGLPNHLKDYAQWIELVQNAFNEQVARWDTKTCGGGLRWQILEFNRGYDYKNTVSNGALFNIASRLARYTGNQTYSDWASKTYDWTSKVGLITDDFKVYDGAQVEDDCKAMVPYEFTINNAVLAHGAANMYNVTGDSKWKDRLDGLVKAGLSRFFHDGIVVEVACETVDRCNKEQVLYKGFLHQWYAAVTQLAPHTTDSILPALKTSAKAAIKTCTGKDQDRQCSINWAEGRFNGNSGVGQEMSVLSAVSSLLVGSVNGPRTAKSSGDSSSSSDDGKNSSGDKGSSGDGDKKGDKPDNAKSSGFKTTSNVLGAIGLSAIAMSLF